MLADALVVVASPRSFSGVGQFYDDFHQLEDGEVIDLLAEATGLLEAKETVADPVTNSR